MPNELSPFYLKGAVNIPLRNGLKKIKRPRVRNSSYISREHCWIYVKCSGNRSIVVLRDNSTNGTFINRSVIRHASIILKVGDLIGLGSQVQTFELKQAETIELE